MQEIENKVTFWDEEGETTVDLETGEVEVDWCDRLRMEECEAFIDCPLYQHEWFNCSECLHHTTKLVPI